MSLRGKFYSSLKAKAKEEACDQCKIRNAKMAKTNFIKCSGVVEHEYLVWCESNVWFGVYCNVRHSQIMFACGLVLFKSNANPINKIISHVAIK